MDGEREGGSAVRASAPDLGKARAVMKTLLAGWFSFEQMGATAGDLMTRDLAKQWLVSAGHTVDVAVAAPFSGGVDWQAVDPALYSDLVFVCGPFGNGWPIPEFLERFPKARR